MAQERKATTSSSSQTTTDHDEIKRWVEGRGGKPAKVKGTERGETEMLRIDFDFNGKNSKLEEISWEEFFDQFEKNELAFLYQEKLASGEESRFFKFVAR